MRGKQLLAEYSVPAWWLAGGPPVRCRLGKVRGVPLDCLSNLRKHRWACTGSGNRMGRLLVSVPGTCGQSEGQCIYIDRTFYWPCYPWREFLILEIVIGSSALKCFGGLQSTISRK